MKINFPCLARLAALVSRIFNKKKADITVKIAINSGAVDESRVKFNKLLQDITERADVMKQWGNPCVREAHNEYVQSKWFGRNSDPKTGALRWIGIDMGAVELHKDTKMLVDCFSYAMKENLAAAEKKYGYTNLWMNSDWMDECREKLYDHIAKGDPRDVAAYCMFLWHHNESTVSLNPQKRKAIFKFLPEGYEWIYSPDLQALKARSAVVQSCERGDLWYWQGDGFDFPESLACPIVVSADKFRDAVSKDVFGMKNYIIEQLEAHGFHEAAALARTAEYKQRTS